MVNLVRCFNYPLSCADVGQNASIGRVPSKLSIVVVSSASRFYRASSCRTADDLIGRCCTLLLIYHGRTLHQSIKSSIMRHRITPASLMWFIFLQLISSLPLSDRLLHMLITVGWKRVDYNHQSPRLSTLAAPRQEMGNGKIHNGFHTVCH